MHLFNIVGALTGISNTLTEYKIENKNHLSSMQNNYKTDSPSAYSVHMNERVPSYNPDITLGTNTRGTNVAHSLETSP